MGSREGGEGGRKRQLEWKQVGERLGITQRAQSLAQSLSGEALQSHIAAHRRLTHPQEMGSLFKALAIVPQGAPLPPGFNVGEEP